jgi:rubrerythrin
MAETLSIEKRRILDICAEVEVKMGDIYRFLTELHKENEKISSLWKKTAEEEDRHAEQIRFAGRLQKGLISDVNVNLATATNALNAEKVILEEFKNSPPTIIEALKTTIDLEEQLYNFHLEYSVSFQNDSYKKLFHTMLSADKEHIESLKKALESL